MSLALVEPFTSQLTAKPEKGLAVMGVHNEPNRGGRWFTTELAPWLNSWIQSAKRRYVCHIAARPLEPLVNLTLTDSTAAIPGGTTQCCAAVVVIIDSVDALDLAAGRGVLEIS